MKVMYLEHMIKESCALAVQLWFHWRFLCSILLSPAQVHMEEVLIQKLQISSSSKPCKHGNRPVTYRTPSEILNNAMLSDIIKQCNGFSSINITLNIFRHTWCSKSIVNKTQIATYIVFYCSYIETSSALIC